VKAIGAVLALLVASTSGCSSSSRPSEHPQGMQLIGQLWGGKVVRPSPGGVSLSFDVTSEIADPGDLAGVAVVFDRDPIIRDLKGRNVAHPREASTQMFPVPSGKHLITISAMAGKAMFMTRYELDCVSDREAQLSISARQAPRSSDLEQALSVDAELGGRNSAACRLRMAPEALKGL
jgi:hypothetical protein